MLLLFLLPALVNSIIVLNESNIIHLKGDIKKETIDKAITDLIYSNSNPVYLFINTNGGDVEEGMRLIHIIESYEGEKKIICIGQSVISMGFSIFQSCHERVVMTSSVAMQHQMFVTIEGELSKIDLQIDYFKNIHEQMLERESKRLNISKSKFNDLIKDEMWLYGNNIVKHNAGDKLEKVRCHYKLRRTRCPFVNSF